METICPNKSICVNINEGADCRCNIGSYLKNNACVHSHLKTLQVQFYIIIAIWVRFIHFVHFTYRTNQRGSPWSLLLFYLYIFPGTEHPRQRGLFRSLLLGWYNGTIHTQHTHKHLTYNIYRSHLWSMANGHVWWKWRISTIPFLDFAVISHVNSIYNLTQPLGVCESFTEVTSWSWVCSSTSFSWKK